MTRHAPSAPITSTSARVLRGLASLLVIGLVACGGDPETASATPASTSESETALPVEVRSVDNDPAIRQRLTPPQILGYFPTTVGSREPSARSLRLSDDAREEGISHADVTYRMPPVMDQQIEIAVSDVIDSPDATRRERDKVETGTDIDPYSLGTVSEARAVEGGIGRGFEDSNGPSSLYVFLAGRFAVVLRADDPAMSVDDLWTVYEESGLSQLAGAGVYGEPGGPEPPAWAASRIAEWEPPTAPLPSPSDATAESTPLASCDVLLPVAEVRRVCEISELKVDTTPFETEGENCNRTYNRGGEISGLIFIVSHFSSESLALAAQRTSMDFEDQLDRRDVAGIGDTATRVIHDLSSTGQRNHILSVASGVDLLELKSSDYDVERGQQVCTLEQMETLARGVVDRLNAASP